MRIIFVEKQTKTQSIVNYILSIFPNLSYAYLNKALRNKDIKVNGKRISSNIKIQANDKIEIYINDNLLFNLPDKIDCIYEDDNILAVYKPQGILSNNEEQISNNQIRRIGGLEPTLENLVNNIYENAKICHRLDRNTSGILLFSKTDIAYLELLNGFKHSLIDKTYIAYVSNSKFNKKSEILEKYLVKDIKTGFSKVYDTSIKNSQKIITKYTVINTNDELNYAVLEVNIKTGKTHQIRTQLANIDHPIIGDSKYGINEVNKKFKLYKQLLFAVKYSFNFDSASCLNYLNNIDIKLDKNLYNVKIGSEIYEKNT